MISLSGGNDDNKNNIMIIIILRIIKIFLSNMVTLSKAILIQIGDTLLFFDGQVMI